MHRPHGTNCIPGGIHKLKNLFSEWYLLNCIQEVVTDVLNRCDGTCKLMKSIKVSKPPPQPVRSMKIMERIQVDLLELYGPKSPFIAQANHNYRYVLSILDCFSKYCWLMPLTSKRAAEVASVLCALFREFGCPQILHSDNGKEFVARLISEICTDLGIKKLEGRPYHPQSQGQVENLNKKVKEYLLHRLLSFNEEEHSSIWPWLLPEVAHHINNTWHSSINNVPFRVFFGRDSGHYGLNSTAGLWPSDDIYRLMLQPARPESQQAHTTEDDFTGDGIEDTCDMMSDESVFPADVLQKAASSFSCLNAFRHEMEIKTLDSLEKASYRNQQAHMKKFKPRQFQVGEKILFRNQHTRGMITTINQIGEIYQILPGQYYQVKYTDCEHEYTMSMHCSSLAPYITDSASSSIAASVERITATKLQDKSEDMLAKTVLEEVLKFAKSDRNF